MRWRDDGDSRLNLMAGNLKNVQDIFRIRFARGAAPTPSTELARSDRTESTMASHLPPTQASAAPARSVLRGASLACTVTLRVLGRHTPNTIRPGTVSCTWTISMFST